ncbi:hypothetical protein WA026_009413 [Henosepilachna vigintioctopunctata]|uniref:Sushi domain-containing protein n=1 Tax=Henosepilachna vigintioctopunctata TaxID=420089 RepID=A0AAW1U651_9CUCU
MVYHARFVYPHLVITINIISLSYTSGELFLNLTDDSFIDCDRIIENVALDINGQNARVICLGSYDVDESENVKCINGKWVPKPSCIPRCSSPPKLDNGNLTIQGIIDVQGKYNKGALATYTCHEGFQLLPVESNLRVCEKGIWTGAPGKCIIQSLHNNIVSGCSRPADVMNGYFVYERNDLMYPFGIGQRLHYSCKAGYILEGNSVQLCLENGLWSPKIQPVCWKPQIDPVEDLPCGRSPDVPFSSTLVVEGKKTAHSASPGTVIEINCRPVIRNFERVDLCKPTRLNCSGGKWNGVPPVCGSTRRCSLPPTVPHAKISVLAGCKTSAGFSVKSEVSYQCTTDYFLEGNGALTCSEDGFWYPTIPPNCLRVETSYYEDLNSLNSFMVSMATGAGVLSLLLVICLLVLFRRKRQLERALSVSPTEQRQDMGDHAILLHQPDRLALIAFADGIQGQRNIPPTYDEATRDRVPTYASSVRLQRPHWQPISSRRNRNSPNPDLVHLGRHGSFVSHTPSTRSTGDSMGSTDTMAVSENSTNVTLDTASSYSGSQAPSCRAHCGSLASFDTNSVIITDDVPLLEENEIEDIPVCDAISLVLENPSLSDSASHKLSTASAEFS